MIKFSRSEDYAVILVHSLAHAYNKRLVPISEVAKEYNISLLFLRNLASELRRAGIIKAIEGKNGGYYLTKAPEKLKMGEILRTFTKEEIVSCCPSDKSSHDKRICPKQGSCIAGNVWRKLNDEFRGKVYNLTLTEFLNYSN